MTKRKNICACGKLGSFLLNEKWYCSKHKPDGAEDKGFKKCTDEGCNNRASFRVKGTNKPLKCLAHKTELMVSGTTCDFEACIKGASFGDLKVKKAIRCREHADDGMVNICLLKRKCKIDGCTQQATWVKSGTAIYEYCKTHGKDIPGYEAKTTRCKHKGCKGTRAYGPRGKKPIFCHDHKLPDYIDLLASRCDEENCDKIAHYKSKDGKHYCLDHKVGKDLVRELANGSRPRCAECKSIAIFGIEKGKLTHCRKHKKDNMEDFNNRKCQYDGCKIVSGYALIGSATPTHCATHADKTIMRLVGICYCKFPGCSKGANYGDNGTKDYCKEHYGGDKAPIRKPKYCQSEGCKTVATYGLKENRTRIYCATHADKSTMELKSGVKCDIEDCDKKASFINSIGDGNRCLKHRIEGYKLRGRKICDDIGCDKYASYGPLFGKVSKCKSHAPKNFYTDGKMFPKCDETGCKDIPCYAKVGESYPTHCDSHKLEGMLNIIERECDSCKLKYLLPDGKTKCIYCEGATKKHEKIHETRVKKLLDQNGINYESHDTIPDVDCNKYRPDFVIDYNTFYVILEVDEEQHKRYNQECEISRMKNLHQTMGMDTLFIRYNPDSYVDSQGKKIDGMIKRQKILIDLLRSLHNVEKLDHYLTVVYLFYDGFDGKITMQKIEY
ncbi:hypothetical protein F-E9_123 [Faustovirus]|nr:hypothetical protein F-E9_123 [Faustovirus]